jgi:hypothetical protein
MVRFVSFTCLRIYLCFMNCLQDQTSQGAKLNFRMPCSNTFTWLTKYLFYIYWNSALYVMLSHSTTRINLGPKHAVNLFEFMLLLDIHSFDLSISLAHYIMQWCVGSPVPLLIWLLMIPSYVSFVINNSYLNSDGYPKIKNVSYKRRGARLLVTRIVISVYIYIL